MLQILKLACSSAVDAGRVSFAQLAEACQEPMDGVAFRLIDGDDRVRAEETGGVAQGAIIWEGVRPGPITIQEVVPAGYGEPITYCVVGEGDPEPFRQTGIDGAVALDLDPGRERACVWFNIPLAWADHEAATVTVQTFWCDGHVLATHRCERDKSGIMCQSVSRGRPRNGARSPLFRLLTGRAPRWRPAWKSVRAGGIARWPFVPTAATRTTTTPSSATTAAGNWAMSPTPGRRWPHRRMAGRRPTPRAT